MSEENDELLRRQTRRDRRQRRNATRILKRQRRLARLHQQGWTDSSLLEHTRYHKMLAEQKRARAKAAFTAKVVDENDDDGALQHEQQEKENKTYPHHPPPDNILRIAVVGCGGWFCNRAHLPILAKLHKKSKVLITVLCGSNHERALKTLRRNGVSLSVSDGTVAAFDTLESYIEHERSLSDCDEERIPRERALANVCLLVLPTPKMVAAIGMCLRAGKYVISEKPVAANLYEAQSLWDTARHLKACHRWVVSENWAYKPGLLAARRLLQEEVLRRQKKPSSYRMTMVQCLDSSGWRHNGEQKYDGGAARDVGVHIVRALRYLFGEVEKVDDCEFAVSEQSCLLCGALHHGEKGTTGKVCIELRENVEVARQRALLEVEVGDETRIVWDVAKGSFLLHESDEAPTLIESVQGDSWIAGGVRELLTEAISLFTENAFGRNPRKSPEHAGLSCRACTPEEAFRDAAVIDAMLASCGKSGVASNAQSKLARFDTDGVRRYLPYPMLSSKDRPILNSLGTTSFHPAEIAWCASVGDVVSAIKWAQEHSLDLSAIGTCHSSSLFQDNRVCISTSQMSRVLDFRIYESRNSYDIAKAYVRVETGMMLNELASRLETTSFTLPSFPILLNQSVGGAIATGSHGSSTHYGTISDSVIAVRLVLFDGLVRTILSECGEFDKALQSMIASETNEIIFSDELMKTARCSCGSLGVVVDVIFELLPAGSLLRTEVLLDMNALDSVHTLQSLALKNEHCWIQWVIGEDTTSDEAAAIVLSRVPRNDIAESTRIYNGRCWYPYEDVLSAMMRNERKRQPGEMKYTLQWSFPLTSLGMVIDTLKRSRSELELASRVVEFKFLSASAMTTMAPNSIRHCLSERDAVVALNVWWDLGHLELFEKLEDKLRDIPGGHPHYGKWFSRHKMPTASGPLAKPCQDNKTVSTPTLSVILPIYNAMPWLPIALRDVLKQNVDDEHVEILAGDDASSDGSLEFLVDVVDALGERGSIEVVGENGLIIRKLAPYDIDKLISQRSKHLVTTSTNPALLVPCRDADFRWSEHSTSDAFLSPEQVAMEAGPRTRLRVLLSQDYVNVGQGAVMTRCLRASRGSFIGHMESDDARPDGAFQEMLNALRAHPNWDGVTSLTQCIGRDAEGMERYVEWQNEQDTFEKMRASRFIEIPALHQTGIFRAAAVDMSTENRRYRDDEKWPVDLHYWLSFFHIGLKVGKVPKVLFYWRQHKGQQTRLHARLAIDNMRRCKCEFLCTDGGPIFGDTLSDQDVVIEIWSTGQTLQGWVEDMTFELSTIGKTAQVVSVDWKPGLVHPVIETFKFNDKQRRMRLFAFGMERVRRKVRNVFASEWNDDTHLFVA